VHLITFGLKLDGDFVMLSSVHVLCAFDFDFDFDFGF